MEPQQIDQWRRNIRADTFAHYHTQMGLALKRAGNHDMAITALGKAIDIQPECLKARAALVDLLEEAGKDCSSERLAAQAYGGLATGYMWLGIEALIAEQTESARRYALRATGDDGPGTALLWLIDTWQGGSPSPVPIPPADDIGRALADLANHLAATGPAQSNDRIVGQLLDFSIAIAPTETSLLRHAAFCHRLLRLKPAWENLLRAEALAPGNASIRWSLIRNALARGDIPAALAVRERLDPPAVWKGQIILDECHLALASGQAEKVVTWADGELGGSLPPSLRASTRALAFLQLNRPTEALSDLEMAADQQGLATWCLLDLAVGYGRLGQWDLAHRFWDLARKSSHASLAPFQLLGHRWIGQDVMDPFGVMAES